MTRTGKEGAHPGPLGCGRQAHELDGELREMVLRLVRDNERSQEEIAILVQRIADLQSAMKERSLAALLRARQALGISKGKDVYFVFPSGVDGSVVMWESSGEESPNCHCEVCSAMRERAMEAPAFN